MSFLVRQHSFVHANDNHLNPGNRFGFAELSATPVTANGLALSGVNGAAQDNGTLPMPGTVWMRPDITTAAQGTPEPATHTQFGVGKSNGDAINAEGTATWQRDNDAQPTPGNNEGSTRQGAEKVPWQDQTYFIVIKYTFNDPIWNDRPSPGFGAPAGQRHSQDDSVSIFINPLPADLGHNAGEDSAAMTALYSATSNVGAATSDADQIASFVLLGRRQGTGSANSNASARYTFDELRIGTTWADVTPIATPPVLVGDFNKDGNVDGADYVMWKKDASVGDYADWVTHSGESALGSGGGDAVPEPTSYSVLLIAMLFGLRIIRR